VLKATLEKEGLRAAAYLEQVKTQSELLAKITPKPGTKPSEGKVTADQKSGYVAELVGYQALKRVSQDITRRLTIVDGLPKDARILIVDSLNYAPGDIPLVEISTQFGMFEARCRKQVADNRELLDFVMQREEKGEPETGAQNEASKRFAFLATVPAIAAAATALPVFSGLIGTVADIAGYFRTDYDLRGRELALKNDALIASIAGSLRTEKRTIWIYNFSSLDTIGSQSKLMKTYAGLIDCSSRLAKTRNQISYFIDKKTEKLAELRQQLKKMEQPKPAPETAAEMETLKEKIKEETAWLNLANPAVLASDAIHGEQERYLKAITTAETPESTPKLAQAMFRERIQDLGITHLLYMGVNSSGGEVVTKHSLFFFTTISYFGGCVVSWVVAKKDGEVLASDTLPVLCVVDFRLFDNWIGPLHQIRFDRPELKK
jgi:hypothetical protein